MKLTPNALALSLVLVGSAHGVVVTGPYIQFYPDQSFAGANYRGLVAQDTANLDGTSAWFIYTPPAGGTTPQAATLQFVTEFLDEGSQWWLAQPGQEFSEQTIASGALTPLYTSGMGHGSYPKVPLPLGDVWLAVRTREGSSATPPGTGLNPNWLRPVYGWVHLSNSLMIDVNPPFIGYRLTTVDDAMSFASAGIFIGTTTEVPEPIAAGTALGVLPLLLHRRRR